MAKQPKLKSGDKVTCTNAASCAYTLGDVYDVYDNDKGWTCIKGDDGLEDIVSMLISNFRKV